MPLIVMGAYHGRSLVLDGLKTLGINLSGIPDAFNIRDIKFAQLLTSSKRNISALEGPI